MINSYKSYIHVSNENLPRDNKNLMGNVPFEKLLITLVATQKHHNPRIYCLYSISNISILDHREAAYQRNVLLLQKSSYLFIHNLLDWTKETITINTVLLPYQCVSGANSCRLST